MNIFAISDLHLSLTAAWRPGRPALLSKPMDIFGQAWTDYPGPLAERWRRLVRPEDTVLIAGDISWAMTLTEALYDFAYLADLPGRKLIVKGNHDYWWQSLSQVRQALPPSVEPLQHSAARVGGFTVCGTRGWLTPGHRDFQESEDRKIYERELLRLEMALEDGARFSLPIIAMLHYPPLLPEEDQSGFTQLLDCYPVTDCVYGHLHGDKAAAFEGERKGVRYHNCSADRLDLTPLLIRQAGDAGRAENN